MNAVGIEPVGKEMVAVVPPDIYVIAPDAPFPLAVVLVIVPEVVASLPLPLLSGRVVPDQSSAK